LVKEQSRHLPGIQKAMLTLSSADVTEKVRRFSAMKAAELTARDSAAERIFSTFPKSTDPKAIQEFIHCDATLMKNVQTVSNDLLSRLPKLNYLVLTPGIMTMKVRLRCMYMLLWVLIMGRKGREETSEGLDKKLAVHYYARWKFTNEVAVYSVFSPERS
jgi:hypothetical protein